MALTAQSLLAPGTEPLESGEQYGQVENGFKWRLNVIPVDKHDGRILFKLDLTLSSGTQSEHFSTFRLESVAPVPAR
ncbi:hypothetical protein D3C87_2064510 [compost metagenome]